MGAGGGQNLWCGGKLRQRHVKRWQRPGDGDSRQLQRIQIHGLRKQQLHHGHVVLELHGGRGQPGRQRVTQAQRQRGFRHRKVVVNPQHRAGDNVHEKKFCAVGHALDVQVHQQSAKPVHGRHGGVGAQHRAALCDSQHNVAGASNGVAVRRARAWDGRPGGHRSHRTVKRDLQHVGVGERH